MMAYFGATKSCIHRITADPFLELRGHHVLNYKIFGVNFSFRQLVSCYSGDRDTVVLGDPEVTANLYCAFAYLYW